MATTFSQAGLRRRGELGQVAANVWSRAESRELPGELGGSFASIFVFMLRARCDLCVLEYGAIPTDRDRLVDPRPIALATAAEV